MSAEPGLEPAAELDLTVDGVAVVDSYYDEIASVSSESNSDDSQLSQSQNEDGSVSERVTSVEDTFTAEPITDTNVIHARAYQMEMFEKSLQQNVIVVMDTGSGKTQVAVLRIQAELKKESDKIIWFLAPTVALSEQQYNVIKPQIGAAQIKRISGADGVQAWSSTRIWDDFLLDVRVVVSTYQILLDAVQHSFVTIDRLSLIVFDEAHNCTGKHAGSKLMEKYRLYKANGLPVPAILGLTASPVMRSDLRSVDEIEQTLDAVCTTPTIHREELMRVANRPVMSRIHIPVPDSLGLTKSMTSLARACGDFDIYKDPYLMHLRNVGTHKSLSKLAGMIERGETPMLKQLRSFCRRSMEIQTQLGDWAADNFIYRGITRYLESADPDLALADPVAAAEHKYLEDVLHKVEIEPPKSFDEASTTDRSFRFNTLVEQLQSSPDGTRCIIFVLETTVVAVLSRMLSEYSPIRKRFRVGTMIGANTYAQLNPKRALGDLHDLDNQTGLEKFRDGTVDILIATSVAEEGIDVPSCDLIISFNMPANLKSYIQRRGRARMENSSFVLLVDESSGVRKDWTMLEAELRSVYEDEERLARETAELEEFAPDPEVPPFIIESTGAQLDFDQARSHLGHFCQRITSGKYVEHQPYYIAEKIQDSYHEPPRFRAVVHLPSSLPAHLRQGKSERLWYSERNAFKDAAFQAFKAIYADGLINDHLMPLLDEGLGDMEARSPLMAVRGLWKPWVGIAERWQDAKEVVQRDIMLRDGNGTVLARFEGSLPGYFPCLAPFKIYWDTEHTLTIETSETSRVIPVSDLKPDQSAALIHLAFGYRWPIQDLPLILHLRSPDQEIVFGQNSGQTPASDCTLSPNFLARDASGHPFVFVEKLPSRPTSDLVKCVVRLDIAGEEIEGPWLLVRKWRRHLDWLHGGNTPNWKQLAIPEALCKIDTVDISTVSFASFIPSMLHMIELRLMTEELCNTILKDIGFSDLSLVTTAICSRGAQEATDYERLEFLGDATLKILATVSVMVEHPYYPEGYLTAQKERIVSNSTLCRASAEKGLDRFILTKIYTARKWRPLYIQNFLGEDTTPPAEINMSTKTLADVVESLVGAAFVDGGLPKAMACLGTFLPDVKWYSLVEGQKLIAGTRPIVTELSSDCVLLEQLIGYSFKNKALLTEAITHGGLGLYTDTTMEQLEFLGDAILDSLVVTTLWEYEKELSNCQMHLLKTATVNADLLGFLVMQWQITQTTTSYSVKDKAIVVEEKPVPFWKFMRHRSYELGQVQRKAEANYLAERDEIGNLLAHGSEYPWAELAHLDLPKFFSDMFEALLGAVWVDSGSMDECKNIAERIGLMSHLRRLVTYNIEIRHPKNKLGELASWERKRIKYETERRDVGDARELFCKVFIEDDLVVEVGGGVNELEVVTKAANTAYHMLRGQTKRARRC